MTDDVIEKALDAAEGALQGEYGGYQYPAARGVVQALAEAGLLARPLPTREEIADVILAESLFGSRTPIAAADAVLALLKGQDR